MSLRAEARLVPPERRPAGRSGQLARRSGSESNLVGLGRLLELLSVCGSSVFDVGVEAPREAAEVLLDLGLVGTT